MNKMYTNFKKAREAAGLSQKQAALTLKVSAQTVSGWESGKICPTAKNLVQLADLYSVSVDYLLGRSLLGDFIEKRRGNSSIQAFSKQCGVSEQLIRSIENKKVCANRNEKQDIIPSTKDLERIAENLSLDPKYLFCLYDNVNPHCVSGVIIPPDDLIKNMPGCFKTKLNLFDWDVGTKLSSREKEHIKKFQNLGNYGKESVGFLIERGAARVDQLEAAREEADKRPTEIVYLYKTSNKASAGHGFELGFENMERWGVHKNELTAKANLIVEVYGDSMEPEFYDGDNLIVGTDKDVEVGEIGLFVVPNEFGEQKGYVKKLGVTKDGYPLLISLNEQYDDIIPHASLQCAGRVLGVLNNEWVVSTE